MPLQKPLLKWVGGKTQIIEQIIKMVPQEMEHYHEPFVGGGSVLFAILSLARDGVIKITGTVYASDANKSLIDVYIHIQSDKDGLFSIINETMTIYDSLDGTVIHRKPTTYEMALTSKESFYYWLRNQYNSEPVGTLRRSALFMVLNKTCFRGIYREGPNGFNVPYGHYKKTPTVVTMDELTAVHNLIRNVVFLHQDYTHSIAIVKAGDFVYLDPPYAPESATSFVGYTKDGFTKDNHESLFQIIAQLKRKNIAFLMSNAKVDMVTHFFQDKGCGCIEVNARRAIHSKKPDSMTTEVLIYSPTH